MSALRDALRPAVRGLRQAIRRKPGPAILMYHRIADEQFDPWGMAVSPQHFTQQAEWLAHNRMVLPLTEFAEAHSRDALPANAAVITFDDGYACTFNSAAPVLRSLGLPANVFVPAAAVQQGREFWWDELERLVLNVEGGELSLEGRRVRLGERTDSDRAWRPYARPRTERQKAFKRLWAMIYGKSAEGTAQAMGELRNQVEAPQTPREDHRLGTEDEVRTSTIDVGCHGLSHSSLPKLPHSEQVREIAEGRMALEEIRGQPVSTFAFPHGDSSAALADLVRSAGFLCGCGSRQKAVSSSDSLFDLPRLVVPNDGPAALAQMLGAR